MYEARCSGRNASVTLWKVVAEDHSPEFNIKFYDAPHDNTGACIISEWPSRKLLPL